MNKIYVNGKIYLGKKDSWVEAVVTEGDKIIFVGTLCEGKTRYPEALVEDIKGGFVFPGFIDAHAHPILAAYFRSGIQLNVEMDKKQILAAISDYVDKNKDKRNYFGQGYAEWLFSEGPTKEELDEICMEKPILILGSSGHEGWCNSKALEEAKVDKYTKDPIPGFQFFSRKSDGEPTGHFTESECLLKITDAIEFFNEKDVEGWIEEIFEYLSSLGITSLAECGVMPFMAKSGFSVMEKLAIEGRLPQRVFGSYFLLMEEDVPVAVERLKELRRKYYVEDNYEFNTLKIINDGTFESVNASMLEPYDHDGSTVKPMLEGKILEKLCIEAAKEGFDIYIHGIGDRAVRATLEAGKAVREAGYIDTRITNAHTSLVHDNDVCKFKKYNVIANTTGCWHYGTVEGRDILGDRMDKSYNMRSLIDSGAIISLGSDFPVDELGAHPMISMEVAHTRQYPGCPESLVLEPTGSTLSIEEIINGYTKNAAYQLKMEDKIGTIDVGKYADFTILEDNPFEVDKYDIHKIKVLMTVKGGKTIYRNTIAKRD